MNDPYREKCCDAAERLEGVKIEIEAMKRTLNKPPRRPLSRKQVEFLGEIGAVTVAFGMVFAAVCGPFADKTAEHPIAKALVETGLFVSGVGFLVLVAWVAARWRELGAKE